jgi:hypothetical protein
MEKALCGAAHSQPLRSFPARMTVRLGRRGSFKKISGLTWMTRLLAERTVREYVSTTTTRSRKTALTLSCHDQRLSGMYESG